MTSRMPWRSSTPRPRCGASSTLPRWRTPSPSATSRAGATTSTDGRTRDRSACPVGDLCLLFLERVHRSVVRATRGRGGHRARRPRTPAGQRRRQRVLHGRGGAGRQGRRRAHDRRHPDRAAHPRARRLRGGRTARHRAPCGSARRRWTRAPMRSWRCRAVSARSRSCSRSGPPGCCACTTSRSWCWIRTGRSRRCARSWSCWWIAGSSASLRPTP